MTTIYTHLKIGTVLVWSWASRVLCNLICSRQDPDGKFERFVPGTSDLRYLNPAMRAEFARHIANYGHFRLRDELEKSWACTLLGDGLVNEKQYDCYH